MKPPSLVASLHRKPGVARELDEGPIRTPPVGLGADCEPAAASFSSGMRSNGTALVIGMASFLKAPLVTVPAAIYIIFQHLLASLVKRRLAARDR